ncbi:MAG: hypothetical protein HC827_07060 [Cyanobacteria bacterium RM1_2_2]|nr:hypothetical protein [Cyanobacteria bacterium RM1_2_2]
MKHSILTGLSILALSTLALPVTAAEQPTAEVSQHISNKQAEPEFERVRLELLEDLDKMFEQMRQEMMSEMDAELEQMHEEMVRAVNERFRQAAEQRINR